MIVLSLDVSSTAAGWAVLYSEPRDRIVAFGVARCSSRHSLRRIDQMREELRRIAIEHGPDAVVMEWSSGKLHRRMKGKTPGLAVMGQAQGTIREAMLSLDLDVKTVGENDWTGGTKKETRAAQLRLACQDYAAWSKKDRGLDAADAIQLGLWWLAKHKIQALLNGKP